MSDRARGFCRFLQNPTPGGVGVSDALGPATIRSIPPTERGAAPLRQEGTWQPRGTSPGQRSTPARDTFMGCVVQLGDE
jgi:hypothetical protein